MEDERLIAIETKLAFLEHTMDELNDVLLQVRAQIDRIEAEMEKTKEQLQAGLDGDIDASFRKPPHY
jgi:uncharacterized coiled-coil protein SlyX